MTAPLLQKPGPSLSRFVKHKVGLDVSAAVRDRENRFQREGALRNDHMVTPVPTSFVWLWWSPTASKALSHSLNFPGRACPPRALEHCALCYIHAQTAVCSMSRTNPTLYVCPSPSWIPEFAPVYNAQLPYVVKVEAT